MKTLTKFHQLRNILATSIAALLAGASANAATLFYDGGNVNIAANGNGASGGTAGTWNTALLNWDQGNALAHVAWSNLFTDTAHFAGTGAAVAVGGTVQVGTMNVASNTYTFNTGTIDFGAGGAGVLNFNNTNSATINATLAGVVKIQATGGTGTVGTATSATINGNNTGLTFTELALNTDGNTIVINHAAALGSAGAAVKLTKGVLNLGNNAAPNNNVPITYNAWTTELAGGTIRARFSSSTWTGATTLTANSGLTTRAAAGVSLIFDPAATINLGGSTLTSDADSASAGIALNGVISGAGNLKFDTLAFGGGNGNGLTTLNAANTFSGNAIVNRGTLALGNGNALQNATLDTGAAAGVQTVTFTVAGANTYNLGALAGSDALEIGANTLSVGAKAVDTAFAADLSGAGGSLAKVGGNTLTLSANTTFSGATAVNNGTLALTGAGAVNGSSGIAVNGAGAKFLAGGATTVAPVVTLTQGTLTGSGTLNTVNVGAGTGAIISNNNGVSGAALTIGTLTLAGAANLHLFSSTIAADLVVGSLVNNSGAGTVTITANNAGGWTNGATYTLISGPIGGTGGDNFAHVVNNLSGRQFATWGGSGAAITLAIAGDNPVWTGAAGSGNWNAATVNWKLVTAGSPTQFLPTDDVLFDSNATGPTTIDINAANVAPNTTVFNNTTAKEYTLGSSGGFGITSGSLTKSNNGKLTITNANTHTGGTTLNAGTLNVNHAAALGGAGNLLTINGGTLDNTLGTPVVTNAYPLSVNGDFAFTGTNALTIGAGASTLGSAAGTTRTITVNASTLTLRGAIGNGATADSLAKTGAGTLILTGASSFTGTLTLASSIMCGAENAGALGAGALVLAGGELQLANDTALSFGRNTTVTGNVQITSDTLTAVAGVAHSLGTLSLGANTLTLSRGSSATGTAGVTFSGATTLTGAPTFSLGANSTLTLAAVADAGNTATFTGAGTFRQTGAWGNGAGGLTFDAGFTGSAVLSAANTFTGAATISGGTVIAQSNTALGSTATGTTVSGGTLDLGGTLGASALNLGAEILTVSGAGVGGNGALVNNGSNDQINATGRIVLAADATFGGMKRWDLRSSTPTLDMGGFNITKVGANQISLVGVTVSNPGNITINGGSLGIETSTNLNGNAANNLVVNPTGTLIFNANTVPIPWTILLNGAAISQNSGSTTVAAAVVLGAGANTINVSGTSLLLNDVVTGPGGFTKTGGNALTLNGPNDYAGLTTINVGRVILGNSDGLGSPAAGTTVATNAILQIIGGIATNAGESVSIAGGGVDFFGALQAGVGGGTWQGPIVLGDTAVRIGATAGNTLTVTGSIANGAGNALAISGQGGSGTVVLNPAAPNTYTGPTNIVRGILRLGKNDALPVGTVLDVDLANAVTDAATFDLAGFNQEIAGLRDTATTNVNSLVSNSGATPATLTINNAADFGYDGRINGDITVTKKGAGAQTLRGLLAFPALNQNDGRTNLNSVLANATITVNGGRLDLNADANNSAVTVNTGGTAYATVNETLASLTINDGGTFVLGNPAPPAPPEFGGEFIGAADVQGVPEPGSAALLFGGMLPLLGARRRRK